MKNKIDEYGRSKLHYVAVDTDEEKQEFEAKRLIDAGADINLRDNNGWTPLHFAAQENSIIVAKLLLEAGAVVNTQDKFGRTPLSTAVFNSRGYGGIIKILREYGANPYILNNKGQSPLGLARHIGNYDISQFIDDLPDEES